MLRFLAKAVQSIGASERPQIQNPKLVLKYLAFSFLGAGPRMLLFDANGHTDANPAYLLDHRET
jgi:hypothetical protein